MITFIFQISCNDFLLWLTPLVMLVSYWVLPSGRHWRVQQCFAGPPVVLGSPFTVVADAVISWSHWIGHQGSLLPMSGFQSSWGPGAYSRASQVGAKETWDAAGSACPGVERVWAHRVGEEMLSWGSLLCLLEVMVTAIPVPGWKTG